MTPDPSVIAWRKSGRSSGQGDQCVEVAALPSGIGIRDSKNPTGSKITLSRREFGRLVDAIRAGRHEI
jgi:hypothetical protein